MTGYVSGKVAIVTGGGRGIGRAIAMLMAKEGASVVVVDIGAALDGSGGDQGPAQDVVKEIEAAGGKAIASTLSITEPQNAEAIVKSAIDAFGRVGQICSRRRRGLAARHYCKQRQSKPSKTILHKCAPILAKGKCAALLCEPNAAIATTT